MKPFFSSAMILLALYAQAASADAGPFYIFKSHLLTNNTEIVSTSPTWAMAGSPDKLLLIGFTTINKMTSSENTAYTVSHSHQIGLGLHQQHTPWMYSQITIKQHPFSTSKTQSTLALNIGF